jgi:uncharacterized membrane protein YphA (DoxX/SURF4 family)
MIISKTGSMTTRKASRALHITLWILQVIVAALFIWTGFTKLTLPIEKLAAMFPWTAEVSSSFLIFTALCDLIGGIGLLLPALLRIKPQLTAWAAIGCAALMLSAIIFHVARGEASVIGFNIFVLLVTLFIAWGRFSRAPIAAK